MPEKDPVLRPAAGTPALRPSEEARARADGLRRRAEAPPDKRPGLLPDALEELRATVEELRVAEEEMRAQNEELMLARVRVEAERHRYQGLFEFAPDGYFVTDVGGKILEANRAASVMLGISARFLKGRGLAASVLSEDLPVYSAALRAVAAPPTPPQEWALRLRRRPADLFHAAVTVAPVPALGAQPETLRWLVRDISARVEAESARSAAAGRERRASDALQSLLLGAAPAGTFPRLDVETFHADAGDVAGGFSDAFALAGGRVALVAGDVPGGGADAAARAAAIKYALRVLLRLDGDPVSALARLDDTIAEARRLGDFPGDRPAVLALATLDAETGAAEAASANAAFALVLRADGTAESFGADGLTLDAGDTLLLLAGAPTGGGAGGPARLAEIAAAYQGDALRGMGQAVLDATGAGGACLLLAKRQE